MDPKDNRSEPDQVDGISLPIEVRLTLRVDRQTPIPTLELVASCNLEHPRRSHALIREAIARLTREALTDCEPAARALVELSEAMMKLQDAIPGSELPQLQLQRVELVLGVRVKGAGCPPKLDIYEPRG